MHRFNCPAKPNFALPAKMGVGGGDGALTGVERAPLPPAKLLAEQSLSVFN